MLEAPILHSHLDRLDQKHLRLHEAMLLDRVSVTTERGFETITFSSPIEHGGASTGNGDSVSLSVYLHPEYVPKKEVPVDVQATIRRGWFSTGLLVPFDVQDREWTATPCESVFDGGPCWRLELESERPKRVPGL